MSYPKLDEQGFEAREGDDGVVPSLFFLHASSPVGTRFIASVIYQYVMPQTGIFIEKYFDKSRTR
jgi:hypothetical protein